MNKDNFKPGNWYVCIQDAETEVRDGWIKDLEEGQTYYMSEEPDEFISKDGDYEYYHFGYDHPIEEYLRPWTLEDAEPGDILKVIIDGEMYLVVYNGLSDERETMEGAEFRWVKVRDGYYNREREKFYDNPHSMFSRHYEKKKEWEEGEWTPATEYEKTILLRYARLEGYTFDYENREFCKMTDDEIGNVHVPLSKAVPWLKEHAGNYSTYSTDRFIRDFVKQCWTKRKIMIKNMEKILTADDARKMTRDAIEKDDSVLYPIMEKIEAAIAKKEFSCYLTGVIQDYVIEKLHKLGYTTKLFHGDYSDPLDCGDYYEVSWR